MAGMQEMQEHYRDGSVRRKATSVDTKDTKNSKNSHEE
jgi:hypothetical protein